MTTARREYEAIISQLRIRQAINSVPPNEAIVDLTPGDEVLVYREKTRMGWTLHFSLSRRVPISCTRGEGVRTIIPQKNVKTIHTI